MACIADDIESAIITNDIDVLKDLFTSSADVNVCLNSRLESPLFLAVKLSQVTAVRMLLTSPSCNLKHLNTNGYSALDLALVIAYDNHEREPRRSASWTILEMLIEAEAEPSCPSAVLYMVRSALKVSDDEFLLRLIQTLEEKCSSVHMHQLLLSKLHRNQPLYSGDRGDELLEQASNFTVKVIKYHSNKESLAQVVLCVPHFADAHWISLERRRAVLIKIGVYLSVMGWIWTDLYQLVQMEMNNSLIDWCLHQRFIVPSLNHLCRLALLSGPSARSILDRRWHKLPKMIQSYLQFSEIDALLPFTNQVHMSIRL